MPAGVKGFQKGIVTNPKGRPPKERALTAILERAGGKSIDVDGKAVSGKQLVARLVWEGLTTGQIQIPGGPLYNVGLDDWRELAKWVFAQIDGPPKQSLEHSGPGGEPFTIEITRRASSQD